MRAGGGRHRPTNQGSIQIYSSLGSANRVPIQIYSCRQGAGDEYAKQPMRGVPPGGMDGGGGVWGGRVYEEGKGVFFLLCRASIKPTFYPSLLPLHPCHSPSI